MKYAECVAVEVRALHFKPPFRRVRLPSRLVLTVPAHMDQSVKYTVALGCALATPGLLPPSLMVKVVSL